MANLTVTVEFLGPEIVDVHGWCDHCMLSSCVMIRAVLRIGNRLRGCEWTRCLECGHAG